MTRESVSDVSPSLARMPPDLLGISLVGAAGHAFTIMSVQKPARSPTSAGGSAPTGRSNCWTPTPPGSRSNSLGAIEAGAEITNPTSAVMGATLPDGGIVTVSPGKGGLGTFAPRLDRSGNSVQGQEVARYLSARLGLDLLASSPAAREA